MGKDYNSDKKNNSNDINHRNSSIFNDDLLVKSVWLESFLNSIGIYYK